MTKKLIILSAVLWLYCFLFRLLPLIKNKVKVARMLRYSPNLFIRARISVHKIRWKRTSFITLFCKVVTLTQALPQGDDYYLVCSSFAMFGDTYIPFKRSGELETNRACARQGFANWKYTIVVSVPVFMHLRYNTILPMIPFYMITTEIASGFGNIIVKQRSSKVGAIRLQTELWWNWSFYFFDEDGKSLCCS